MTRPLALLTLAHFIGNAVLLAIGYYWLGVGESSAANLLFSAGLILLILFGAAWLHGSSFAHFRSAGGLPTILCSPLTRLLPLAVLAAAVALLYLAAEYWNPVSPDRINRTASYLTLTFQTPVRPAPIERVFNSVWWIVEWMLLPLLLLPLASNVAVHGWRGLTQIGAKLRNWRYWLLIPALVPLTIWLPFRLMAWTPAMSSFAMETASLIARFGAAYLLFVTGGLALAFVTSRGKPFVSQETTAVSP
jgi:hypothetical protein